MQVIDHIEIHDGQGILRGRNLKAKMVARMHIWEGKSVDEVMRFYDLTPAEVYAAITFYYDNQAELDAEYEENMRQIKQIGRSTESFRAKIDDKPQ